MTLNCNNLSFSYGKKEIFSHFNFSLESKEILGISGPSGAGKSTLAKVVSGYLNQSSGEILIDGKRIEKNVYNPVQMIAQHPEKSVNPRLKMKSVFEECGELPENLIEDLGIKEEWLKRWANELSGGELQRFCIARSLSSKTKFLFADEISSMLDAITQAHIWKVILNQAEKSGLGIIVISHDISLLNKICTKRLDFKA